MRQQDTYEGLVAAALEAPFSGWNFDYLVRRLLKHHRYFIRAVRR